VFSTASIQAFLEYLRRQPSDLRLEVILAELLEVGYSFDDFLVRSTGLFARCYRRDLGAVREEKFERAGRPSVRTVFETHRAGLYDFLPPQVFHLPGSTTGDAPPGVRGMVEDIREQRRREQATRLFFLPFEQEFYRCRVRIEQEERRYFTNVSARWYNEALAQFWNITNTGLPPGPLTNLLYMLPLAHSIVGDLEYTRLCFESVLGHSVQLRMVSPLSHPLPLIAIQQTSPGSGCTLGHVSLGCDMMLAGSYHETLPALEVSLRGLAVAELETYLNNEWPAKALNLLCEYFIAFETDVVVRYEMGMTEPAFLLGEGETAAVLGFTTAGI
jgi:hypothetical protein